MNNSYIKSVATANPPRYVKQQYALEFMQSNFKMSAEEQELYQKILSGVAIEGRYVAVDFDEQICLQNPDDQNERFLKYGRKIGTEAAKDAIAKANLQIADISGLIVNTCTGYLCPGLSSYIVEDVGLSKSAAVFDIMGMGCGAAIPNLQLASSLTAGGHKHILSVAVEICSATFFTGDDPGLVVSNCIFGDGAGAVVVSNVSEAPNLGIRLLDFETLILPRNREHLRYRMQDGRLRNVLSKRVPVLAAKAVLEVCGKLMARNDMKKSDVDFWVVHPGGTAVLEEIGSKLDLSHEQFYYSFETLKKYGNMSSPSVLYVLKELVDSGLPKRGQKGILVGFGAGFSAFAALAEF